MNPRYNRKVFDFLATSGHLEEKAFRGIRRAASRLSGGRRGGAGRSARRVVLSARFDPNARDGDNDGLVQEMTRWERPAGPRNLPGKPFRSVSDNEETDLDELLSNLNARRQARQPIRLTAPDEPDKTPSPRGRRPDAGRAGKPVTPDSYRGQRTILPWVAGPTASAYVRDIKKSDWDKMVADMEAYFDDAVVSMDPNDAKFRALQITIDFLKKVKVTEKDKGIVVEGTDIQLSRISKSLRAIKDQGNKSPNLGKISAALKTTRPIKPNNAPDLTRSVVLSDAVKKRFNKVGNLDANKAAAAVKAVEDRVQSKFGKIESKRDAINALNAAHPDIKKNFHFLRDNTNGPLSQSERGLVVGYLHMLIEQPELKSYTIAFRGEKKAGVGGSAGIVYPWDSKNRRAFPKTMVRISYKISRSPFEDRDGADRSKQMDSITNQGILAYVNKNPDNLPDRELIARADFMSQVLTALHESAHVRNATRSLEDFTGGDGGNGPLMVAKAKEVLKDKGVRGVSERIFVANEFVDLFNRTPAQQNYLNILTANHDAVIQQQLQMLRRMGRTNFTRDEMDQIEAISFAALMFDNPDILAVGSPADLQLSELGQMWDYLFPDSALLLQLPNDEVVLRPVTKQNLSDALDEVNAKIAAVNSAFTDSNEHNAVKRMLANTQNQIGGSLESTYQKFVINDYDSAQKIISAVYDTLNPNGGYDGVLKDYEAGVEPYGFAFAYMYTEKLMDSLTDAEVAALRSLGKSISKYAGATSSSFYGYTSKGYPVEVVAELRAAMSVGKFPTKGTPEYAAAKKLITWMYGPGFWNEMEQSRGE